MWRSGRPRFVCLADGGEGFEEFFDSAGAASAPFEQVGNFFCGEWRRLLFEGRLQQLHLIGQLGRPLALFCDRNGWFRDGRLPWWEVDLFRV
ncbi:MAG: hypothetical protein R3C02_10835 [Planctomycetaceae bacterium]